ncbi:MAG TPA: hypothetical protein VD865_13025 [Stenotrophomonas sp.]|nr:hypothetical protein [Stenotrophomonas sp.]
MKYIDGKPVVLGDHVTLGGGVTGTVVAIIDAREFSPGYPADEWSYLEVGALVRSSEGGLIHLPVSKHDFALVERARGEAS